MSIIELQQVSKIFHPGKAEQRTALAELNLSVAPGEIVGIVGYSGAGKSTLLRLINGLEKASSGRVIVDGEDITDYSEAKLRKVRSKIGMIFQSFNLFQSRTVYGNIAYPLKVAGWKKPEIDTRVAQLLDYVGLLDRAYSYPEQLSGGQKQRVGIARALASSPKILLADESTSALDPETTQEVLKLLKRVNQEFGITIVAITHEMEVVRKIANRVLILESGKVVESGDTYQIFSSPKTQAAKNFVGTVVHDLPNSEELALIKTQHPGRIVAVKITEQSKLGSALSQISKAGLEFEIVFGGISSLAEKSYGWLTLAIWGQAELLETTINELQATNEIQEL